MAERKPKASELQYFGSEASPRDKSGKRSIVAVHEGRIVGHLGSVMVPGPKQGKHPSDRGRQVNLAWVDPDLQRRGVGTTMLRLEAWRSGHKPIGDYELSKKGQAFQRGLGLTPLPIKGYGGQEVHHEIVRDVFGGPAGERAVSETIQKAQGRMLQEQQFHPDVVTLAAPHPTLPRRRSKPAVQEELFPASTYDRPTFGGGTPRNARGQIQSKKRQQ